MKIALIREGKIPADNRVVLTPSQCKWVLKNYPVDLVVQHSDTRCFTDREYTMAGVDVREDISDADIMMGIKEVPVEQLIGGKTYLFFSHTKKKQPHNRKLLQAIIQKNITLIDYECLEHEDGERLIGFGFFAGIVGAHNGMMAWGRRTGAFALERVYKQRSFRELIHSYFGLKLPNLRIVITGSGRVAHGVLEIMNLMGIHEVESDEYLSREFSYPVYTQLKGGELYEHRESKSYNRTEFHQRPESYQARFLPYARSSDILMNGVYWDLNVPRLFRKQDIADPAFRITTIADITDDKDGSVPINLGDQSIEDPVYGVDRKTLEKTAPYLPGSVDIMAVGNLPNELPRDASRYFGEQIIKHLLADLIGDGSPILEKATMVKEGDLTDPYQYLQDYVLGNGS